MHFALHQPEDVLSALVTILGPPEGPPMEFTLILVTVRENEPFEKALRRFRRKVEREGIRKDIKKNSFYLKPGEKRRLKQRLAEKRRRKAMRRSFKRR
jgi:small subunit ribosomal protein S21